MTDAKDETRPSSLKLDDEGWADVLDDVPFWSAPFGLLLLDRVRFDRGARILDVGCGSGFPLLELAQRFGASSFAAGLDPWAAGARAFRRKQAVLKIPNARYVRGAAESMPFRDGTFDLVVSNNGLNNVADMERSVRECRRVSRAGARLLVTFNLPSTMTEMYAVFEEVLRDLGREGEVGRLRDHIFEKRKTVAWTRALLERCGFEVAAEACDTFRLRYLDGTAMLNHSLIRLAFLGPWEEVVAPEARGRVLAEVEARLNAQAAADGELALTVPMACLDALAR